VLSSLLFEIQPRDITTFTTVAVLLAVVAFVACLVPATRAAQMDPLVALREE
jgi:putative ABC transport system permease protein